MSTALLQLVLIICVRTDPVCQSHGIPQFRVLAQASNKATHGFLPRMANKPTRELRFCVLGNELHEAARVPQGGGFDDPMRCMVEVEGLQLQGLLKIWAARVPGVSQSCCQRSQRSKS